MRVTFSRDQEIAADRKGMELALRANYSYLGGLSAIRKMIDLGLNYSSFEGLAADHPSWFDRIGLLDKQQAGLWRSMSSFDNGVYFLLVQNYPLAERAFRQVTKDFPASYEAWANLGYALLMQYADSLSTIGNDPNDEKLQVVQLYFLLGLLPKDTSVPIALTKQIAEWNANLTVGKVVVVGSAVLYTSSSWLSRTDADGLAQDAVLGHYLSKSLRKEVAPYLKP